MSTEHPRELISASIDSELSQQEQARLEEHLRGCDACRTLLADFRTLAVTARREAIPGVPAGLAARIGARTATPPRATSAARRPFIRMRLSLATAAAALLLVSVWIVWQGRIPERPDREETVASGSLPADRPAPSETAMPPAQAVPPRRAAARDDAPPPSSAPALADAKRPAAGARPPAAPGGAAAPQPAAPPITETPPAAARIATAEAPPDGGEAPFAPAAVVQRERRSPGMTLVFPVPEGRVTVTSGHVVTIASGDYLCRLDPIGAAENEALDRLFEMARAPEAAAPRAGAAPEAARDETTIAATGEAGALFPDVTAEMQRRLRALLIERFLPRAEAVCGPPPAALRDLR